MNPVANGVNFCETKLFVSIFSKNNKFWIDAIDAKLTNTKPKIFVVKIQK